MEAALESALLESVVDVSDIARECGISQEVVRKYFRTGRISGRCVGWAWITTRPQLERLKRELQKSAS